MTPELTVLIRKEAEEKYPEDVRNENTMHWLSAKREAYIAAAEKWAGRIEDMKDTINAESEKDQYLITDVAVYGNEDGTIVDVGGKNYIEIECILFIIDKHLKA